MSHGATDNTQDIRSYEAYSNELTLGDALKNGSLISAMTKKQYLDVLSAPRSDPMKQGEQVILNLHNRDLAEEELPSSEDERGPGEVTGTDDAGAKARYSKSGIEAGGGKSKAQ